MCFGAWYLLVKACQWMPCILLSWHSKNCTCSLVQLPYYVSHLRSVLELDVKATCFLFSCQPAVLVVLNASGFLAIRWWILKTGLLQILIFIKLLTWFSFMIAKHLFSEVLWYRLKEELCAIASVCLDLFYETDIWVYIKTGIYEVKLLPFIL